MKFSVIDISSSSLSMIVAEADNHKTEIIYKDRVAISLLHYREGKTLSLRGMEKLAEGLRVMKETSGNLGADRCYLIATAAFRHIGNCEEVSAFVQEKTGLAVNFIDGTTEAYCDYVANVYYASYDRAVLIDVGGKSVELCDFSKRNKDDMVSLDFGLLDLHRKFIRKIQPNEREAKEIREYVSDRLDDAGIPSGDVFATAIIVGATGRAVYDIYAEFADVSETEEIKTIRYKKFKKLVKHLLSGVDRSALILNNAPEKLYYVGPAAIVLKTLFKRFGVENIIVSDKGVKEGYLQLVLEGKETGLYFDFARGETGGIARRIPELAPTEVKEKKEKKAKKQKAEKSEKSEEGSVEPAEKAAEDDKKPVAKRGRPKKVKEKTAAESEGKSAEADAKPAEKSAEADKKPAAKRGRPRKVSEETAKSEGKAEEAAAEAESAETEQKSEQSEE